MRCNILESIGYKCDSFLFINWKALDINVIAFFLFISLKLKIISQFVRGSRCFPARGNL